MTLLFDGSFQYGDRWISRNGAYGTWTYSCLVRSNSLIVESAPDRAGYAGRFELLPGDLCNSASDSRAQVDKTISVFDGAERWYSFSTYFPYDWQTVGWGPMLMQIKKNIDSTHFSYIYAIYHGPDTGSHFTMGWKTSSNPGSTLDLGTFKAGWTDWLINIRYSSSSNGYVYIYRDGALINSLTNTQTLPDPSYTTQDYDVGLYEGNTNSHHYYVYNAKVGETRADVEYLDAGGCISDWQCEQPLNGYESDGCGNRRTNAVCDAPPPPPPPPPPPVQEFGVGTLFIFIGGALILNEILKGR